MQPARELAGFVWPVAVGLVLGSLLVYWMSVMEERYENRYLGKPVHRMKNIKYRNRRRRGY